MDYYTAIERIGGSKFASQPHHNVLPLRIPRFVFRSATAADARANRAAIEWQKIPILFSCVFFARVFGVIILATVAILLA